LTTTVTDDSQALSTANHAPATPGLEQAKQLGRDNADRIRKAAAERLSQLGSQHNGSSGAAQPHIGEPTVGQYVAFDVAAASPYQFIGPPPYQPSKVIAAGEDAYLYAYAWVNPAVSVTDGFAVPPTIQLGGRQWRISLDLVNITDGTRTKLVQTGTFAAVADSVTAVEFLLPTPDPGLDPALYEANVTFDIVDPAQPYAAFATSFYDWDDDPGFMFAPPESAGWRYELPNRYLVYRQ
jgi:hypothetical protein